MKTPDCVIWALTKRNNSYLVKFNGNEFTHNPLSVTNFHNATESASTLSVAGSKKLVDNKKFKRTFSIITKHKMLHGAKKTRSAKSQSQVLTSTWNVTREVNHAAKVIQGLTHQTQKQKNLALIRLARQSAANRQHVAASHPGRK